MKFLFICLLIANALLFVLWQGFMESPNAETHQPQRLLHQENSQQLKLISAQAADTPAVAAPVGASFACLEWGSFQESELTKAEALLSPMELGSRQSRQPAQETASTIVYIPPLSSKAAAEKKADELKSLGVNDFFIIQDNSSNLRWGISLGVFKSEEAAKQLLARLNNQGVRSAVLGTRTEVANKYDLVFNNVSSSEKARLDKLKAVFPEQDLHVCK
jgi:cell division septation protein DedD